MYIYIGWPPSFASFFAIEEAAGSKCLKQKIVSVLATVMLEIYVRIKLCVLVNFEALKELCDVGSNISLAYGFQIKHFLTAAVLASFVVVLQHSGQ